MAAYVLRDAQEVDNDYWMFGTIGRKWEGTSFVPSSDYALTRLSMKLKIHAGTPTGNVTAYVYSNNAGKPGTLLATSTTTISAATVTSTAAWFTWDFAGIALTSGTTYHLVLATDNPSDTNSLQFRANTGTGKSVNCSADASTWSSLSTNSQNDFRAYSSSPFSYVQKGGGYNSSNITLTTNAGSLLVALVAGSGSLDTSSISVGGGGETWLPLCDTVVDGLSIARMFYCLSAKGGSSTWTWNNPCTDPGWWIMEFAGATQWALNDHMEGTGGATSDFTSGALTTTVPDALLVGAYASEYGNWLSWTNYFVDIGGNTAHYDRLAYRAVAAAGSYAATGTKVTTEYWEAFVGAFYDTGGAGPSFNPSWARRHSRPVGLGVI